MAERLEDILTLPIDDKTGVELTNVELVEIIERTPMFPIVMLFAPFKLLFDIDIPAPLKRFTALILPMLLVNTIFAFNPADWLDNV